MESLDLGSVSSTAHLEFPFREGSKLLSVSLKALPQKDPYDSTFVKCLCDFLHLFPTNRCEYFHEDNFCLRHLFIFSKNVDELTCSLDLLTKLK